ncbi:hypothetical protein Tco_0860130 [Tanacetum coccineum]|uniref:Integrase, catalytic region, zinc finger, CCHC-type, peptidase aspartic, catalytic n=1 Tax=Tanacetum coccineum TaxID=301880 RepID=A0ABQ5BEW0_9ASTR
MGRCGDKIATGTDGPYLGPERDRVVADLSQAEKDRQAGIRATNILLQGLPRDIYKLINHNTDAKDIWDNVKMLLEGLKLTKDDCESQLYDEFEHFGQHKGENIHDYYVRFTKLINDMRHIKMTMPKIQLNSKFVNNLPEWGRFVMAVKLNSGNEGAKYRISNVNAGQGKPIKCYNCNRIENGVDLDEEQLLFLAADQCDAFDSDVDEGPTAQTMLMANLSSADPVYDEVGPSYDSDTLSEVHDHNNCLDNMNESHKEYEIHNDVQPKDVVDSDTEYTIMIITNDIYEQDAPCVTPNNTVNASLTAELARYKELADVFEKRAQFELTERELMIDT